MKRKSKILSIFIIVFAFFIPVFLAGCARSSNKTSKITYKLDNEEEYLSLKVKVGDKIYSPEPPSKDGYVFEGWFLEDELFVFDVMPDEDITLTAKWNKLYTITFLTETEECEVAPIIETANTPIEEPQLNRPSYYLKGWKLNGEFYNFTVMPDEDITLTADWEKSTNLPAMFIDLKTDSGETIDLSSVTKETYVNSSISLVNTEEEFTLNNVSSKFKGRGNSSFSAPKKGYKIKFDKKQSLFGHASNKHWVIIACALPSDATMYRNYLAYSIGREVLDGIEYTTTTELINVYINREYRGVYLLCEHVRVDKGRVDIDSDYGVNDTGYLIEYDAFASGRENVDYFKVPGVKYRFTVHSPDPGEYASEGKITKEAYKQQIAFIKDYVTQVYTAALNGDYETFSSLVDVDSFVDMYILHELFKNADTGWSSFYLYKKPGGKLYAGPAWDFDSTTTSTRGDKTPEGIYVAGSVIDTADYVASELYISLYQTESFKQAVITRWREISSQIESFINNTLNDEMYETNKEAMGKNFAMYENKTQETAENDWLNDISALKQWLLSRIEWLNGEWI